MNTMMLPSMQTDKTLSIEGVAADAKAVGDNISQLNDRIFSRRTSFVIPNDFTGIYQVSLLDYLYSGEYALVSVTVLNSAKNPEHVGEFLGYVSKARIINTIVCQGRGQVGMSVTDNVLLNINKTLVWSSLIVNVTVI